jgi:HJR/Mrr/RecB family endonuclease
MLDLYNNKYDQTTLKNHIYELNLVDILKTQKVDALFVAKYILNKKYQLLKEELLITSKIVLFYQPHILPTKLKEIMFLYDSDDDSVEDFETISNKDKTI